MVQVRFRIVFRVRVIVKVRIRVRVGPRPGFLLELRLGLSKMV